MKNNTNNNNTNNNTKMSFVDSFKNVSENLALRYTINMHLDFIQEFIKFADNTRDINLQESILSEIQKCEQFILNLIKFYEDENNNKENAY